MATQKQKQALVEMVENGGNVSQAMIEAGYSPSTAHTPSKLTDSKAFKEFEVQCLENGLSAELVIRSLVEDIERKPGERVSELLLASKLLGLLDKAKQEQSENQRLPIPILGGLSTLGSSFNPSNEEREAADKALQDLG